MDAKCRKSLRSALAEPNIAKTMHFGRVENILYRIWYIVPRKIINAEIPERRSVWTAVDRLLRVLVASIVP